MRFTSDPRVRQAWNQISDSLESANQNTQTSLFAFSENYIGPCFTSLQPCFVACQTCLEASCQPCCQAKDDIRRHRQPRYLRRGRERAAFDFYDDWDQQEEEWGNDELDRLLAGEETLQPGRRPNMSYGSRGGTRRTAGTKDGLEDDPTLVPQSSIFGFLERLPWKIGGRGLKYKPSPANLRVNVGKRGQEAEPLLEEDEDKVPSKQRRKRSSTVASQETANSLSSRGDIFPSDDEDDAREIDDDFALALGRRPTGGTSDDTSGKQRQKGSRTSTNTASPKNTANSLRDSRANSASSTQVPIVGSPSEDEIPSIADLKLEEEAARVSEERDIQQKRDAAKRLASDQGLSDPAKTAGSDSNDADMVANTEVSLPADTESEQDSTVADPVRPVQPIRETGTEMVSDNERLKPS